MAWNPRFNQLFTHMDILRSHKANLAVTETECESQAITPEGSDGGSEAGPFLHCPRAKELIERIPADFVSLLNFGWNKVYKEDIKFYTVKDPKDGIGDFEIQLLAGPWGEVLSKAKTKKAAKHKAAAELILKIIEGGRHKEFLIPGLTPLDAQQIVVSAIKNSSQNETDVMSNHSSSMSCPHVPFGAQTNWVGKVQEYIMKKKFVGSTWKDAYEHNGPSNALEHTCKVHFQLTDIEKPLEGRGQARTRKQAKQFAFKEIWEQLIAMFGSDYLPLVNGEVTSTNSPKQKISMEGKLSSDQQLTENDDRYALTLGSEDVDNVNVADENQIDIKTLLSHMLSDRENNTIGAEQILRMMLKRKDPKMGRDFEQAEVGFIEPVESERHDNIQVYLELWRLDGHNKLLMGTFGGQGKNLEMARDDASWQAMEYIYIFGGFAPSAAIDKIVGAE